MRFSPVCPRCGSPAVGQCVSKPALNMLKSVGDSSRRGGAYKFESTSRVEILPEGLAVNSPPLFGCLACSGRFSFWELRASSRKAACSAAVEDKGGTDA